MEKKKLIEVALPLEAINAASAREKSIRHGHPSTLHLWWARRPLAAARAVIWASLVDDPSSHPEEFPTEEDQAKERERLFGILEELVVWENSNNQDVLNRAKKEIEKSTGGNIPALLDPFAGGGAIPLEAQRLGLEAHAHDLNPVAVMINKAMIEIPPKFANMPPVNPDDRMSRAEGTWSGTEGLAADVRYYGNWIKEEAYKRIGNLYPKVSLSKEMGGGEATVIAWIWARTVKCPNPACGRIMPLSSSYILSKKKGKEAWVEPVISRDYLSFRVNYGKCPAEKETDKVGRAAVFRCCFCGEITTDQYVKQQGKAGGISSQLMAIVGEGQHGRLYISPCPEHINASHVLRPDNYPDADLPTNPRWFTPPAFGLTKYSMLFSNRQITGLTVFSHLVRLVQNRIVNDAVTSGLSKEINTLEKGGNGAIAYSQAIAVYLSFVISKIADRGSSICSWDMSREGLRNTFGRQAMPMTWDYAEANPFSSSSGSFDNMLEWIVKCIEILPSYGKGVACQHNAQLPCSLQNVMISTDPPYYDNIGYADLSDYFYLWMRWSLKEAFPDVFCTMMVPKTDELIATPYRHNGSIQKAKEFFENGLYETCCNLYGLSTDKIPLTIYYGYKQKDSNNDEGESSSGWETMLSAIIKAGFSISGTWPMRTEMANRSVASGTNALASSIVLVCRKRPDSAISVPRRNFINELKRELRPALQKLQQSNIAPVDLAQSSIGPGMAVFSKYKEVLEADGSPMSVRSALQIINQELDIFFNEQDGELDRESRFCVELYTQSAFNDIKFGDADTLARAKNTSVAALSAKGVLYAQKGVVHLLSRDEITKKLSMSVNMDWLLTQHLTRAMETGGIEACAKIIAPIMGSDAERAKALAYRLYTIAERKGWAQEAFAYNSLVIAWQDIQSRAADMQAAVPEQLSIFDFAGNEEE